MELDGYISMMRQICYQRTDEQGYSRSWIEGVSCFSWFCYIFNILILLFLSPPYLSKSKFLCLMELQASWWWADDGHWTRRARPLSLKARSDIEGKRWSFEEEKIKLLWVYRHALKSPQIASCGVSIHCGGQLDISAIGRNCPQLQKIIPALFF